MQLANIVGTVVATRKTPRLDAASLMLVQPVAPDGTPRGATLLAVDGVGAGIGERVLIVLEGKSAGAAIRRPGAPVDAAIVGIVDTVELVEGSAPHHAVISEPSGSGS